MSQSPAVNGPAHRARAALIKALFKYVEVFGAQRASVLLAGWAVTLGDMEAVESDGATDE